MCFKPGLWYSKNVFKSISSWDFSVKTASEINYDLIIDLSRAPGLVEPFSFAKALQVTTEQKHISKAHNRVKQNTYRFWEIE